MEQMLKKANDARAAATAAEKELKKAEEGLKDIMLKVATQERDLEELKHKAEALNKKAKDANLAVRNHPDSIKEETKEEPKEEMKVPGCGEAVAQAKKVAFKEGH